MFQRYLYSFLLIVALLFSNLGLAINIHYCGGAVAKIELGYASFTDCSGNSTQKKESCKKEKIAKKSCCKDQTIKQKTDDVVVKVFQAQHFSDFVAPVVYKFQPLVLSEIALPKKVEIAFHCNSNAPPLYKLYHQYLLYA